MLHAQKLQVVAALECFVGLFRQMFGQGGGEIVHLLLQTRALVRTALDLVQQHVAAPSEFGCGTQVVELFPDILDLGEQVRMVPPGHRSHDISHSL